MDDMSHIMRDKTFGRMWQAVEDLVGASKILKYDTYTCSHIMSHATMGAEGGGMYSFLLFLWTIDHASLSVRGIVYTPI